MAPKIQTEQDIIALLERTQYSDAACDAALAARLPLRGQLGNPDVRLCLIAAIRRNITFARSGTITTLCSLGQGVADFVRARNARFIMSGEIPVTSQMTQPIQQPYCIWYPDIAPEDTYRQLAIQFPSMRYQVGRACAVAGYTSLYHELDLLPDASIAEEARESHHQTSRAIYSTIMKAPVRYSVMDDYNNTIKTDFPEPGAVLNGDTAVLRTLHTRLRRSNGLHLRDPRYHVNMTNPKTYFNITEDLGVDVNNVTLEPERLELHEVALLVQPLPQDLPTMRKDLLVLVAAYEGNLDRYVRLRRPGRIIADELTCVLPGIYRSTAMAMWFSRYPKISKILEDDGCWNNEGCIKRAINARHVMNGHWKHLMPDAEPHVPDSELPYWIWYPTVPSPVVLQHLAEKRPMMRPQCARACIAAGFQEAYTSIMDDYGPEEKEEDERHGRAVLPAEFALNGEAERSSEREWYSEDLRRRREELGIVPNRPSLIGRHQDSWKRCNPWLAADQDLREPMPDALTDDASCLVLEGQDWGMWENLGAELGRVRRYLSEHQFSLLETGDD